MSVTVQSSSDHPTHEERLKRGVDQAGVGSWELDLATHQIVWSASASSLLGLSGEPSISYELFLEQIDPDDRDRIARAVEQAMKSESSIDVEFRTGDASGPSRWLRARGGVVRLEPATPGYLCGILFNIDEEKRLESELRMQQGQLRSILDTVPDAMILIDGHGIMRFFSNAAERMFGFSESEAIGRNVSELMPPIDAARHDAHLDRYRATGERHIIGIGRIVTGQRSDGKTFPMHLSIGEMQSGGKQYFTGFIRDLTEYQQTQARLHDLQSELVHVSRLTAMGEMASALAHELNQPLSAISNYMKGSRRLLAGSKGPNTSKIETAMDRAAEQALRAGQIIRRLRDFVSRGESEKRVESLAKLIEEAGALGLTGAREQGVLLRFNLDPANDLVLVDRVQIQQVLVNLFRNALEAMALTPKKELSVSNFRVADDMIEVVAADTGSGIQDDVRSSLFQTFFTTKETGMGVGLSISRSIIEAHGGRMWAESNNEGGATFRFTLPLASSADLTDAS
ncbi:MULTISPECIES: sensor protein FixL [Rhodopseudomonas]|uniref:Sensor protein FixL n=1 Tax=Rhodopseudomonas palustris TaxID=1076 RepID=A0A0D7EEQ8_RHOPL|nr:MULTISPECIES: sensor protein FixL [Rhodopseudomonas]KIZ39279.1 histidine kinase [Rhodopseudomonas palustris]MDF3813854.1 PAS domain S-box protein [Rhodopseudomonas sp. BAL398]WOK15445.1 sensor protein FixL [Rhodopseudomonas sp. BAL398]